MEPGGLMTLYLGKSYYKDRFQQMSCLCILHTLGLFLLYDQIADLL